MPRSFTPDFSRVATLLPAATRTTQENGASFPIHGGVMGIVVYVATTAVGGTSPTLIVQIQDSPDGVTWAAVASTSSITAAGNTRLSMLAPLGNFIRAIYVVGGTTPSFTGSVLAVIE